MIKKLALFIYLWYAISPAVLAPIADFNGSISNIDLFRIFFWLVVYIFTWVFSLVLIVKLNNRKEKEEYKFPKAVVIPPTTKVVSVNWPGLKRFLGWQGTTEDLKKTKLD